MNVVVEKYNEISVNFFTHHLRAQNPRWLPNLGKKNSDMKSIDVRFSLVILTCQNKAFFYS